MVTTLAFMTLLIVFLLSSILFGLTGEEFGPTFWDTLATTINAWMPYSEEGGFLHILFMAIGAIVGILFTSLLIGIVTTAVEEKLDEIRTGNAKVIETNHIVIMGIHSGIYRLLKELILSSEGEHMTIVIAGDEEKLDMYDKLNENIEIPEHVTIRYRKVDVCDPTQMDCLSLPTASKIIMNHESDETTMKSILAVTSITGAYNARPTIITAVYHEDNTRALKQAAKNHTLRTLQSDHLISRLIAHTCIRPGLSFVFEEIFEYEGLEFYFDMINDCIGMSFGEITQRMDHGIPIGYQKKSGILINPDANVLYQAEDQLIYLAQSKQSYRINLSTYIKHERIHTLDPIERPHTHVLMIGQDRKIPFIEEELSEIHCTVTHLLHIQDVKYEDLLNICCNVQHVIILGGEEEGQLTDEEIIRTILLLKSIRQELNNTFNITAEMMDEKNKQLIIDDQMDFIIASDFSNMVIAQIADSPNRLPVFRELLSVKGNEINTIPLERYLTEKTMMSCSELRQLGTDHGYTVLGYRNQNSRHYMLTELDEQIKIGPQDDLIVLSSE